MLAQQQVQTSPAQSSPWHDTPRLMPFINACAERWQKIPLSLAGWRFKEAQCAQEGTLRLAYSKPVGATVGDFAYRVKQVYAGQTTPYFNLPGQGDTGGFSQSVILRLQRIPAPCRRRIIRYSD
ncbi:MAG TPA: type 4b pilus protein PilO2 [Arsenophonus nasoniae]|uniref:type 4b pilus protein PilO2 n=2 Tax=Arsenophonus nasoniae TaxID=638 RepID=UPI003879F73B